jgi:ribosome biogenesis GTPase A
MKSEKKEQPGNINWYPGHMKKTRELIASNLKMVDAVIEVADARIPVSSRNPILAELTERKPRILILSKADLADPVQNKVWAERLEKEGLDVTAADCRTGKGIDRIFRALQNLQDKRDAETARKRPVRLMIVGVPNAGKSSLINRLTGKKSAQVGNRPGVTRGKQWLTLKNGMQLLDTPGILWPKFEDRQTGLDLAFCGSIKDEIMDVETLALELIKVLLKDYRKLLSARYKIDEISEDGLEAMEQIARKRGFIFSGNRIDYERTANTVLDEFRAGTIGRITLERADA